jgi:hypothetical protein
MSRSVSPQSIQLDALPAERPGRQDRRVLGAGGTRVLPLLVMLGLALGSSRPAGAVGLDFENADAGSDAASLGVSGLQISGALVLSESFVETLLGYPATGTWNTTPGGTKGALNTLAAKITLDFDVAIESFEVDVLALPDAEGNAGVVRIDAWADGLLVGTAISDAAAIGDSGLPEATLALVGSGITRIEIGPDLGACLACPALPTSVWIDQVRFEPIPEPATAALLGLTLAALATNRRMR